VDIRRFGLRLRVGFQLFLVLVATVVGIGVAMMIRDAIDARGVIIEPFSVPPDLAQRGLTGEVIAQQVLDQIANIQTEASARSARPASSYSSTWGTNIKVEVPTTGVSFGELRRYLHEALGHETHLSGEIYTTPAGVTVTARTGDEPGKSSNGRPEELERLIRQAAESIYEQTQPNRFTTFLTLRGGGTRHDR